MPRPPIMYDKGSYYLFDPIPAIIWYATRVWSTLRKVSHILTPIAIGALLAALLIIGQWAIYNLLH